MTADDAMRNGIQFFMTNRAILDQNFFGGFHKQKNGDRLANDRSYIYRISTLAHAHLTQVEQFIEDDIMLPELTDQYAQYNPAMTVDVDQVEDFMEDDPDEYEEEMEELAAHYTIARDIRDARAQYLKFDNFRFQRSLGTEIEEIVTNGGNGYTIKYKEGDYCNVNKELKFSAEVWYVCDPEAGVGKPQMAEFKGNLTHSETAADCHYRFEHRSVYACSQCRPEQVEYVRSACSNGLRDVHILPKER